MDIIRKWVPLPYQKKGVKSFISTHFSIILAASTTELLYSSQGYKVNKFVK